MKALCLALTIALLTVTQSADTPIAGTWTATLEGRTFIKLELRTAGGVQTGGLSLGNIQVDSQGVVKHAEAAPPRLTHIFGITRKGPVVTFSRKDENDTDQFELRMLGETEAELRFLLKEEDLREIAAAGAPPPKPIRLTKAG